MKEAKKQPDHPICYLSIRYGRNGTNWVVPVENRELHDYGSSKSTAFRPSSFQNCMYRAFVSVQVWRSSVSLFPTYQMGFNSICHGPCATVMYFTSFLSLNSFLHPIFGGMYSIVTRKRTYVLCVLKTFLRKKVWHKEWCEKKQCLRSLPIHVPYSCKKKLTSSYVSSMHWWMRSKEEWAENNSTTISTVMIKLMTKITIVNKKYIDDLVTLSHYIYRFMHSK